MLTFIDTNQRTIPRSKSFDESIKLLDPNGKSNLTITSVHTHQIPKATKLVHLNKKQQLLIYYLMKTTVHKFRRTRFKVSGSTDDLASMTSSDDKSLKNCDDLLSQFKRQPSSKDSDELSLATVAEGQEIAPKQRVQLGDGVKALLASRRTLNSPETTVSHIKKLTRSLSARLLGNHKSSRRHELLENQGMDEVRLKRPRHLRGIRRARSDEEEEAVDNRLRKTISSDHLYHDRLDSPDFPPESPPGSVSSNSSNEKKKSVGFYFFFL
ncbi:hypothetical protein GCK32_013073 [Trichostrongylus colubriformis]|uniref:Uncharacterized protein n=1 Tax=Trichostrongylus colubriformis TaxID=6319 RepID=A0AAN8FIA6_TRICO